MSEFVPSAHSKVIHLENGIIREEYEWSVPFYPTWRKEGDLVLHEVLVLPTPVFVRGCFSSPAWRKGFRSAHRTNGKVHFSFKFPPKKSSDDGQWEVKSCKRMFLPDTTGLESLFQRDMNVHQNPPYISATWYLTPSFVPKSVKGLKFMVEIEKAPFKTLLPMPMPANVFEVDDTSSSEPNETSEEEVDEKSSSEPKETSEAKGPSGLSGLLKRAKKLLFGTSDAKPKSDSSKVKEYK